MTRIGLGRGARAVPPPPLVCRWDLDKTYLRSDFNSIRQLLRTAFERAEDKVDVPGVSELIRALKQAAERQGRSARVFFISASPPQIGRAIRSKLELDRVPYDGIVFKNQLQNLRPGKLHNLREHVGFKLVELLRGRLAEAPETCELCFGDDWESDPLIYSLYADVLAGGLAGGRLRALLRRIGVDQPLVEQVLALAARAAGTDAVARIFINLERRTPPGSFRLFGRRVVPTFNYFQTAAVLAADGFLGVEDLARVGAALRDSASYTPLQLENSLGDVVRREALPPARADELARPLRRHGLLPPARRAGTIWRRALAVLAPGRDRRRARRVAERPLEPPVLEYESILDALSGRAAEGP